MAKVKRKIKAGDIIQRHMGVFLVVDKSHDELTLVGIGDRYDDRPAPFVSWADWNNEFINEMIENGKYLCTLDAEALKKIALENLDVSE